MKQLGNVEAEYGVQIYTAAFTLIIRDLRSYDQIGWMTWYVVKRSWTPKCRLVLHDLAEMAEHFMEKHNERRR